MKLLKCLACAVLIFFAINAAFSLDRLSQQPNVKQFIHKMVRQHGFNQQKLEELFDQVTIQHSIIQAMNRPYEAKPWDQYRALFITPARIKNGVAFWHQYHHTLEKVAKKYKVSPAIIVATIGVESAYGKSKGSYGVLNVLTTLAFHFPRRAQFFQKELVSFLLMARQLHQDPTSFKGSYAGAIGQAQFMPSSFLAYAVDYDKKGKIDLSNNEDDVIASIANYYHKNGWRLGQPVAVKAIVNGSKYKDLQYIHGKPTYSLTTLKNYQIQPSKAVPHYLKAKLITLESENSPEFWLGFYNFYVITRYNTSNLYAMVVYQLANTIEKEVKSGKNE